MIQMGLSLAIRVMLYGFLVYYLFTNAAVSVGQIGGQWGVIADAMAWPLHAKGTVSCPTWFLLSLIANKHFLASLF